mmetsp:Transcript_29520/g.62709  ORF Transcript_29520/g.62709 Transcript_29520/m.62709 type:complete len:114 (+) Transcript_29520:541-882(+)
MTRAGRECMIDWSNRRVKDMEALLLVIIKWTGMSLMMKMIRGGKQPMIDFNNNRSKDAHVIRFIMIKWTQTSWMKTMTQLIMAEVQGNLGIMITHSLREGKEGLLPGSNFPIS